MKTISFYNEKGGVGKTTLAVMYASWLKYVHGVNVGLVDFDMRIESYRRKELRMAARLEAIANGKAAQEGDEEQENTVQMQKFDRDNLWPIVTLMNGEVMDRYGNASNRNARWFRDVIRREPLKDCDIVILDLPGTITNEILDIVAMNSIGLVNVPFDRDAGTIQQTILLSKTFEKIPNMRMCGTLMKIQSYKGMRRKYEELVSVMQERLPVLPDMISFSERVLNFNVVDGMRSTLYYPDWEQKFYEGSRDLGFDNLFIDVTRELRKTDDLPGTPVADLSFIDRVGKKDQPARQLRGTKFPEYEE